mgnify:CR=1 FL=1
MAERAAPLVRREANDVVFRREGAAITRDGFLADVAAAAARLPAGLDCAPDPGVERGGLRIETADGGVEDGPGQWRRILAEAFREC